MTTAFDFTKKSLIIVTGASQGIGRMVAMQFSKHLDKNSTIILIARSEPGLNETKQLISEHSDIYVKTISLDLAEPDREAYAKIIDTNVTVSIEQAIIFHNAGQIGTLDKTTNMLDINNWRTYFDLNFFSVGILNAVLYDKLKHIPKLFVVNITSLCGRKPFEDMAMYGSAKAARDLYFRVFALEESHATVLNYSPGPVDTAMVNEICTKAQSETVRNTFHDLKEKKTILTPLQTTERLFNILKTGSFKSGDVVDYYDEI